MLNEILSEQNSICCDFKQIYLRNVLNSNELSTPCQIRIVVFFGDETTLLLIPTSSTRARKANTLRINSNFGRRMKKRTTKKCINSLPNDVDEDEEEKGEEDEEEANMFIF